MGHASQENTYLTEYNTKVQEQGQIIDDLARNNSNNNLLWSWSDTSGQVLMETKLGVSIDITTLLGDYQPIDGKYGIRMVLTGTTKPSEDEMSKEIIETVYFTNESMYGNTYGYYSPYTQQKIFDLSGFLTLTHIDIYFWQDHENHIFRDYNGNPIPYTRTIIEGTNIRTVNLPENIIVANLQVLMGLTADEATEDRVIIYSYDDKNYGITEADLDNPTAVQWQKDNAKKDIKIAWIHIDPADGKPVLVDHEIQSNAYDVNSLEYWHAKIYWYNYQYGHPLNNGVEAEKYGGVNWKPKPFDKKNQTAELIDYFNQVHIFYEQTCTYIALGLSEIDKVRLSDVEDKIDRTKRELKKASRKRIENGSNVKAELNYLLYLWKTKDKLLVANRFLNRSGSMIWKLKVELQMSTSDF